MQFHYGHIVNTNGQNAGLQLLFFNFSTKMEKKGTTCISYSLGQFYSDYSAKVYSAKLGGPELNIGEENITPEELMEEFKQFLVTNLNNLCYLNDSSQSVVPEIAESVKDILVDYNTYNINFLETTSQKVHFRSLNNEAFSQKESPDVTILLPPIAKADRESHPTAFPEIIRKSNVNVQSKFPDEDQYERGPQSFKRLKIAYEDNEYDYDCYQCGITLVSMNYLIDHIEKHKTEYANQKNITNQNEEIQKQNRKRKRGNPEAVSDQGALSSFNDKKSESLHEEDNIKVVFCCGHCTYSTGNMLNFQNHLVADHGI